MVQNTNSSTTDDKMENSNTESSVTTTAGQYVDYSENLFNQSKNKKRVYFFHAKWCPTRKAANQKFEDNADQLPANVVLFKTDYDTETALKQRYGITYQHTFVQVDENGNELA